MNDWDLLQDFVKTGSADAFGQLAARHTDWIYSSILRRVRDPHLAEDATQAVFTILFQKAPTLRRGTVIPGWLYTTARYVALATIRREARRKEHEEMAAINNLSGMIGAKTDWKEMEPLLEEGLDSLRGSDRSALILRFFQNQSHAGVGESLGVTEAAAAKRVSRAVEKLRQFFKRKGTLLSAALLAQFLSAEAVQAAPASLLATISGTAFAGTVAAGSATAAATAGATAATGAGGVGATGAATMKTTMTLAKGAMKMMFWAKMKTAAVITVAAVAVGGAAPVVVEAIAEEQVELKDSIVPDEYVGQWQGQAQVVVDWCKQKELPVSISIASDSSVTGRVGNATLENARFEKNSIFVTKVMKGDILFLIKGDLTGPIVQNEGISRKSVILQLRKVVNENIRGGVATSGSKFGGKNSMILTAGNMILTKTPAPAGMDDVSLPGDIILHISTGPLETSIKDIEAFLIEAAKGSPLEMQIQPGMIEMMLSQGPNPTSDNFPSDIFDKSKSMHFLLANPQEGQGQLPAAVIFSIKDLDKILQEMTTMGWAIEEPEDNVYLLSKISLGPGMTIIYDLGDGRVVVSTFPDAQQYEWTRDIGNLFKEWKTPPTPPEGTALMATFDVEKFMELNAESIEETFVQIDGMQTQPQPNQGGQGLTVFGLGFKPLVNLGKTLKATRLYLKPNQEALTLSTVVIPKEGTDIYNLAEAYGEVEPKYELIKLLPKESAMVIGLNNNPALGIAMGEALEFIQESSGEMIDAELTAQLREALEKCMAALGDEDCSSYLPDPEALTMKTIYYKKVKDIPTYTSIDLPSAVFNWLNHCYEQFGLPITLESAFTAGAGTVEGVTYDQLTLNNVFDETQPGSEQVNEMFRSQSQLFLTTIVEDTQIISRNIGYPNDIEANAEADLGAAIKVFRDKTVGIGTREEFIKALDETKSKQIFFGGFYLINLIKMYTPMLASLDADNTRNVSLFEFIQPLLDQIPDSTQMISFFGAAKQGRVKLGLKIPSKAVSETVQVGMNLYMQAMMQRMQAPGAEEPDMELMPPEEEAEIF